MPSFIFRLFASMRRTKKEVDSLLENLTIVLPIANSHMVNFLTCQLFNSLLPKCIQEEIKKIEIEDIDEIAMNSFSRQFDKNKTVPKCTVEKAPHFSAYLDQTLKLSLNHHPSHSNICIPFDQLCEDLKSKGLNELSTHFVKTTMSEKKSHEVKIMSELIAVLAKSKNCSHIVDIGGGKGHLSSVLSLKHQLKVLSIDSSIVTSESAVKKIPKIEKLWKNLNKKSSQACENTTYNYNHPILNGKEIDISKLCKISTCYITKETDIMALLKENFQEENFKNIMLVGLHTCGNLAASSLRLFVENPDHARCLVNVGCCYHLMVEEFDHVPHWLEVELQASGVGFPMSAYLKSQHFSLGRNARMLAAQAVERISHGGKLDSEPLFYRALLEYYLVMKLGPLQDRPFFRVGKISRKCSNFIEYLHKSIDRLGLDIQVDDDEVKALYDAHAETRRLLHAFFLIRLAAAPAVEALIMLDRLLYLQEQGIEEVYLTQLFDPVVSPRCFAIVAFNKPVNNSS